LLIRAFGERVTHSGGSYDVNGSGKFDDISQDVLAKLKKLSVSHIWYTGVISHATKTHFSTIEDCNPSLVKGEAGSPYAIRNYFDVDPALANNIDNRMQEFLNLVERTHKAGMKVIIDFVPNHVYREYGGYFNKENYYILDEPLSLPEELGSDYIESPARATGNDRFDARPLITDWYDTVKLNYDKHSTWIKMYDILHFWADKGVDGFRCDMVELVPQPFFKWAISRLKETYPEILFIAEVYDKNRYCSYSEAGFDLLYDKSGFYDALRSVSGHTRSASTISWEWQFLGELQPKMLNFLENHDEPRVASDFYAGSARASFPMLAVSLLFNTAPFMIYFGQEFGERGMEEEGFSSLDGRTSIFDYCCVPSIRRWLSNRLTIEESVIYKEYCRLTRIAVSDALFSQGETFDLMYVNPTSNQFDADRQFAWLRGFGGKAMLIVANFDEKAVDVEVNIPQEAYDCLKINNRAGAVRARVNPRDYMRVDVSGR